MNLQTKKKKRYVLYKITTFVVGCILCACGGSPDSEPTPDPTPTTGPSLKVSPSGITLMSTKGDSKNIEIETDNDVEWEIFSNEIPKINVTPTKGVGNTTVSLTTKEDNETQYTGVLQVVAKNKDGGTTTRNVSVTQLGGVEPDCYARIMRIGETENLNMLVMSYSMACVMEFGNNTKYFLYHIYKEDDFNSISGNNDRIEQDATKQGTSWKKKDIPSSGGVEILYDDCQPNTRYRFVTIAYSASGKRGEIYKDVVFMTKDASESNQPRAEISAFPTKIDETHDGNQGPWYKWDVTAKGKCKFYLTYACASDTEFETMSGRTVFGDALKDNVDVAWKIWKESKKDNLKEDRKTNFNSNNTGGREVLFGKAYHDDTQWLQYRLTDKYLQIITWAFADDDFESYSGVVQDVVYKIENGQLIPQPDRPDEELTATPLSLRFQAASGTADVKKIKVTSNADWTVSSSKDWCHLTKTFGSNDGPIDVWCDENDKPSEREAKITITTKGGKYVEISVTQEPKSTDIVFGRDEWDGDDKNLDGSGSVTYTLSLNVSSLSTSPAGESKTVNVTSNDSWTVSSNQSWCTVSPSSGSNNGTVKITTAKNTTSSSRTATVTIKGTNSGKTITVTVSQNTYTLSVSPTSLSTSAAGETKNVNVTSNDIWTVSSNQSWCTVSPSSGSNNGTVKITTAKNTTSSSRTATVTIKGTNSGKSVTVKVTQDAGTNVGRDEYDSDKNLDGSGSFTLSVSTSSLQMKAQGESKTVSVSSNDSWTVTSNQSWCTVTPSSGTNNGTIKITSSNNTSSSRTATVTIKGKNSGKSVTVKVTQDAGTNIGRDEYGSDKKL